MSSTAFFPNLTPAAAPATTTQVSSVQVSQVVTVNPVAARSDLLVEETKWSWQELRDYVVSQIEQRFGPFPRDARKEYGIFNRFLTEHGENGIRAAKAAFEIYDGWWNGAPISVNRFTRGSDPYFVTPILERLDDARA